MSRWLKRVNIAASMLLSVTALMYSIAPRVMAWSFVMNSNLKAKQRAYSCDLMAKPVQLGQKTTQNPGRLACYWDGSTGEVQNDRVIRHIQNGNAEEITKILEGRGFRQ